MNALHLINRDSPQTYPTHFTFCFLLRQKCLHADLRAWPERPSVLPCSTDFESKLTYRYNEDSLPVEVEILRVHKTSLEACVETSIETFLFPFT